MPGFLLSFLNSVSYCVSLLWLLSVKIRGGKRRYLVCFGLLLVSDVILYHIVPYQAEMLLIVIPTLVFGFGGKCFKKPLFISITSVFILRAIVAFPASLIMLLAPDFHGTTAFNLMIAAFLPVLSWLMAIFKTRTGKLFLTDEGAAYAISVQTVVLAFFNFILPALGIPDKQRFAVINLSFMVLLSITAAALARMNTAIRQSREIESRNRQAGEYCKAVQEKYVTVIRLRHYYDKLFATLQAYIRQNDMPKLRKYFEENIIAIHEHEIGNGRSLSLIKDDKLRNLIEVTTIEAARSMGHIAFDLQVLGETEIPEAFSQTVFEVCNILIDNAVNNLRRQETGLLRIAITPQPKSLSISVANTLMEDIPVEALYQREPKHDHGYGLRRVTEIVGGMKAEHYTFKAGSYGDKPVLTQQLRFIWED